MSRFAIAVTGDGLFMDMWITHGMTRFPQATFYDRSAKVTAFRQAEADLDKAGYLNAEGRAAAKRIAENLKNPPEVDATVEFSGQNFKGKAIVTCKNGNRKEFDLQLVGISDKEIAQLFFHVDAAVTRCKAKPVPDATRPIS